MKNKLTIEITKDAIVEKLQFEDKEYIKTYSKVKGGYEGRNKSWEYESELPDELIEILSNGFGSIDGTEVLQFFLETHKDNIEEDDIAFLDEENVIKLVYADDWNGLYVNDKMIYQNHSIKNEYLIKIMGEFSVNDQNIKHYYLNSQGIDHYEFHGELPQKFTDIDSKYFE